MTAQLFDEFMKQNVNHIESVYFINLKDVASLRTRSCKNKYSLIDFS